MSANEISLNYRAVSRDWQIALQTEVNGVVGSWWGAGIGGFSSFA